METEIIGFCGLRRSGKDTAATSLVWHGYQLLKFADCLKDMLRMLFRYTGAQDDVIERLIEGDLKETPVPVLNMKTTRWAMQTLGTEWGRDLIGQNLWADATIARARKYPRVVISDVRFPNEVAVIKKQGGRVIRIIRPDQPDVDSHVSEQSVLSLDADSEIINDGTVADLQQKVLGLLQ